LLTAQVTLFIEAGFVWLCEYLYIGSIIYFSGQANWGMHIEYM